MEGIDIESRGKEEEGTGRERRCEEEEGAGSDIHRIMGVNHGRD